MANTTLLPIKETLDQAWKKVYGSKNIIWAAVGITVFVGFGIGFIAGVLAPLSQAVSSFINWIGQVVTTLLQIGLLYIGIMRAKNSPIRYTQVFRSFEKPILLRIIGVYLIQFVIFFVLSLIFAVVPVLFYGNQISAILHSGLTPSNFILVSWLTIGFLITLFVALRLILAIGFVIDKGMFPWQAIKSSFRAARGNEWRLLIVICCQLLALFLGTVLFVVGLIWAVPFAIIIYGEMYKKLMSNAN